MPIRYTIQPDLDLLLYVFEGECTARGYFQLYHEVYRDPRRHHGMKILMDLSNAILDMDVSNLREAVDIMAENKTAEFPPDHVAVFTYSSGLRHLKEALTLLANNIPVHLEVFHNFRDAVRWLDLAGQENEALCFWQACLRAKNKMD